MDECGLVTRHARGKGDGGRGSNQYELRLDITLGPSSRPKGGHNVPYGFVSQNETGGNASKTQGKIPTVRRGSSQIGTRTFPLNL